MAKKQRASRKPGWKEALVVIALAVLLSLVRQMSTPSYDMSSIPDYDGTSAYTVIDRNQPSFTEDEYTTDSYEYYSTPGGGLRKIAGQRLAGAFLSLYAHGDEQTSGGQLCPHGIGLSGQRRLDLGRGGRLRQPFLRQLQNCQRAEAAQPLGVFRCGVQIKFFLQLSRADDRHLLHTALL